MTPHNPHNGKGGAFAGLTAFARKVGSFLMKLYTASRHESGESVRLLRTYPELRLV